MCIPLQNSRPHNCELPLKCQGEDCELYSAPSRNAGKRIGCPRDEEKSIETLLSMTHETFYRTAKELENRGAGTL